MPVRTILAPLVAGALLISGCGEYRNTANGLEPTEPSNAAATSAIPSPGFEPTPTAERTMCPLDGELCAYAKRVETLVQAGRVDELLEGSPGVPTTCENGFNEGLDETFPLCEGAMTGEVRYGFDAGTFQAEGYTTDLAGTKEIITRWSRSPAVRVYTIGCQDAGSTSQCDELFTLVLSADTTDERPFLGLVIARHAGRQEIIGTYNGRAIDLFREYVEGGVTDIGVDPLDPSTGPTRFVLLPQ